MFSKILALVTIIILVGLGSAYAGDDWAGDTDGAATPAGESGWTEGINQAKPAMSALPDIPEAGSGATILSGQQYRIGPSDEIEIEVFQAPDLSGIEKVNQRGYINMPLIGLVMVAGLTQQEAEQRIAEILAKDYLQDPHVNIDIKDYVSQQVVVLGSVKSPGVYPLKGPTTLLQAIALAGGPVSIADDEEIVVFRADEKGAVMGYIVNLKEIQKGVKKDPKVVGNDRIVVPKSGSRAMIKGVTDTLRGFIGFGTL